MDRKLFGADGSSMKKENHAPEDSLPLNNNEYKLVP